ncbi:hypothetical protein ACSMX9_09220 [Streptomyces sp. LE64]|uniref:hypothetical protein n=1 Tax=Streptomyces sp. LE64 TaxID=3448653 RepID=UPI0040431176
MHAFRIKLCALLAVVTVAAASKAAAGSPEMLFAGRAGDEFCNPYSQREFSLGKQREAFGNGWALHTLKMDGKETQGSEVMFRKGIAVLKDPAKDREEARAVREAVSKLDTYTSGNKLLTFINEAEVAEGTIGQRGTGFKVVICPYASENMTRYVARGGVDKLDEHSKVPAYNGQGAYSVVSLDGSIFRDGDLWVTKSYAIETGGSKLVKSPPFVGLAHELIHAAHILSGAEVVLRKKDLPKSVNQLWDWNGSSFQKEHTVPMGEKSLAYEEAITTGYGPEILQISYPKDKQYADRKKYTQKGELHDGIPVGELIKKSTPHRGIVSRLDVLPEQKSLRKDFLESFISERKIADEAALGARPGYYNSAEYELEAKSLFNASYSPSQLKNYKGGSSGLENGAGELRSFSCIKKSAPVLRWTQCPGDGGGVIVAMGDSYISGEAGRWVGNEKEEKSNAAEKFSDRTYPLGTPDWDGEMYSGQGGPGKPESVYPDSYGTSAEPGCHRSDWSEVDLIDQRNLNLACSGATTWNVAPDGTTSSELHGEKAQTEQLAQVLSHGKDVRTVVLSVGGNDVDLADIAHDCAVRWFGQIGVDTGKCKKDPVSKDALTEVRKNVERDIQAIRQVFTEASIGKEEYRIIVQSYPLPLPPENGIAQAARSEVDETRSRFASRGCPFWNKDFTRLRKVGQDLNVHLAAAAAAMNTDFLDMEGALEGHELCREGTQLQEKNGEPQPDSSGTYHGIRSSKEVEWVRWVNGTNIAEAIADELPIINHFYHSDKQRLQESLHPNHLGQRSMSACLQSFLDQTAGSDTPLGRIGSCRADSNGTPDSTVAEEIQTWKWNGTYRLENIKATLTKQGEAGDDQICGYIESWANEGMEDKPKKQRLFDHAGCKTYQDVEKGKQLDLGNPPPASHTIVLNGNDEGKYLEIMGHLVEYDTFKNDDLGTGSARANYNDFAPRFASGKGTYSLSVEFKEDHCVQCTTVEVTGEVKKVG